MKIKTLLTISTLMLACACGGNRNGEAELANADSSAVNSAEIRIAYTPTVDALPYFVAYERGFFADENIDVALVPFTAHMDVDTALVGGSVNVAFTDIIRANNLAKKENIKLDYITTTECDWALMTNRMARLNRLEQFGDKIVAMTRLSATDSLTDIAFKGIKTTSDVYRVQINDVWVRLNMMLNNELDAAWMPQPQATMALLKGHKQIDAKAVKGKKYGVLAYRGVKGKDKKKEENLLKLNKIYSRACDSINKYGLMSYSAELKKYCNADTMVVNRLPKMVFTHAQTSNATH